MGNSDRPSGDAAPRASRRWMLFYVVGIAEVAAVAGQMLFGRHGGEHRHSVVPRLTDLLLLGAGLTALVQLARRSRRGEGWYVSPPPTGLSRQEQVLAHRAVRQARPSPDPDRAAYERAVAERGLRGRGTGVGALLLGAGFAALAVFTPTPSGHWLLGGIALIVAGVGSMILFFVHRAGRYLAAADERVSAAAPGSSNP